MKRRFIYSCIGFLLLSLFIVGCASLAKAKLYLKEGNKAEESGQLEEAQRHYREAISEYENYPDAWSNLGMVYARQGKADLAKSHFLRAIAIDPTFAAAYFNLGRLQEEEGKLEQAKASYQKVLEINEAHAAARVNLALLLLKQNERKEAEEQLALAMQKSPEYAPAYFNFGRLLYQKGNVPAALRAFQKGCELRMPASCSNASYMRVLLMKKEDLNKSE